ncbi:hypothetical protein AB0D08_38350 [Kitasatospora sp. NPDC048540]|uniref:hypothetical protein n=1 Tax=Kitasatospora sp. NPDC048540 TaxID=3155634 RepID=UPI0033E729B9
MNTPGGGRAGDAGTPDAADVRVRGGGAAWPMPHELAAPWRDLPMLALVLAQAFAPAAARARWARALFAPFWLVEIALQRACGQVLSQGPALLVLRPPRPGIRNAARTLALLPFAVAALYAAMTPPALAGAAIGAALGHHARAAGAAAGTAGGLAAGCALLLWQLACLGRAARVGAQLRAEAGQMPGRWVEVASLAGGRDGQATRDLVRGVLQWADRQQVALVAVAADERLGRLYGRAGFAPARAASPVLVRTPGPAGSPWRPGTG